MLSGLHDGLNGDGLPDMLNAFEIAALVYDDGVSVDELMGYFAGELRDQGRAIGGIVQLPPEEEGSLSKVLRIYDLMTGDVIGIKQRLGSGSAACSLDTQALAEGASRVRRAIDEKVDLIFISKFSTQEIAGQGFRQEFGAAVAAGIPILTSVKRPLVDDWLRFTGGIGTLLSCRLRVVRDWWQETDARRMKVMAMRRQPASNVIRLFDRVS